MEKQSERNNFLKGIATIVLSLSAYCSFAGINGNCMQVVDNANTSTLIIPAKQNDNTKTLIIQAKNAEAGSNLRKNVVENINTEVLANSLYNLWHMVGENAKKNNNKLDLLNDSMNNLLDIFKKTH